MIDTILNVFENFPYSVACGCIVAISSCIIGLFVLLKRVAFISVAMTECSACGIALASLLGISYITGSIILCLASASLLSIDWEKQRIPRDAVLGTVFVGASALSILIVANSGIGMLEVKSLLYGDLLLAANEDFNILLMTHIPIILLLLINIKKIMYVFFDRDFSIIMRLPIKTVEAGFFIILALVISTASKICGALLVFSYLIISPSIGLLMSKKVFPVLGISAISGIMATIFGLTISYYYDFPGNQCIVVFSCIMLLLAFLIHKKVQI